MEKEYLKIVKNCLTVLIFIVMALWLILTSIDYVAEVIEFNMQEFVNLLLFNPYLYGALALLTCQSIISEMHRNAEVN